ncbi:heme peroxidase [Mycena metata]|uniref:Peroxidase n=1 Tax=Mycena metata TaxID=1033252 RepID=A0AAD7JHC8_9AGAR|nr:heme peroxidase [Mycena metata]
MRLFRLSLLAPSLAVANCYVWPSPQLDALEALRWDQAGVNTSSGTQVIAGFVEPCGAFVGADNTGRANVADWIRTAYHDMATYNVTDGTGGMDASIRDGFANTLAILEDTGNPLVSIADMLAVGAIMAIESCGGPVVAFRGGRVDTVAPNNPGVPEPQDPLESHIAVFARQNFTQTEMIGLVACGHTFGGVQNAAFPQVVPVLNDPNNTESVSHFDQTFTHFDNNIAMEYISGTTQNPLVVGLNDTTNSDKRIFGSDGNTTMLSFANSADLFASTCASLFTKMLNTVPAGVQLTEVINPLPVKPDYLHFNLGADGESLQFSTQVRLWDLPNPNSTHTVLMLWDDRASNSSSTSTPTSTNNITLVPSKVVTAAGGRFTASWYSSPLLTLDAFRGITNMRFFVDGKLEDQDGVGFAVADDIVWSDMSCVTSDFNSATFAVAVCKSLAPTRVYLETPGQDSISRPISVETDLTLQPVVANATYNIWSVELDGVFNSFTSGAEVDGEKISRGDPRSLSRLEVCA